MVKILSWSSIGELAVLIRNRRYTYYGVSPYWYDLFAKWIRHGRFGIVLEKLKCFSDKERHEELGGAKEWIANTEDLSTNRNGVVGVSRCHQILERSEG